MLANAPPGGKQILVIYEYSNLSVKGQNPRRKPELRRQFRSSEDELNTAATDKVTARWNDLLSCDQPFILQPECRVLVRAAANRPLLRQLFPVVSLGAILFFSRTTEYPFCFGQ